MNWIKLTIGILILGVLIFIAKNNINPSNTSTSATISTTSTKEQGEQHYESDFYYDLKEDVKKIFGESFLKTTSYDLNDLYSETKTPNPYTFNAKNYNFVFSTGKYPDINDGDNEFRDLQVFSKNKLVFEDLSKELTDPTRNVYRFNNILNADYNKKSYYLIEGWSGGAHCCHYFYPVIINGDTIKIGEQFSNGNAADNPDFFIKNGSVYVWMQNSSFSYFISSYLVSNLAFFPSFYRIDELTGNLVPSDDKFKEFYAQFINERSAEVEKIKNENFDENTMYIWPPVLAARTIYQLKSGQNKNEVMKQFDIDFRVLKKKYNVSEFIYVPYVEDFKNDVKELEKVDFKYVEKNGLPDAWYKTDGLDKIKQDVVEMALGK